MHGLELAWQVFLLRRDAFVALDEGQTGLRLALAIVFLGGLSSAFGQSLVLFVNRVGKRRFALSLVLSAVLFVFSYVLWATSLWLIAAFVFEHRRPYVAALRTVGVAYVPQILAFLTITPYFGTFVAAVLSIWTLLAIAIAGSVAFDLTILQSAASAAGGWLLLQVLQRTIGMPIRRITSRLIRAVAGQPLMSVGDAIEKKGPETTSVRGPDQVASPAEQRQRTSEPGEDA